MNSCLISAPKPYLEGSGTPVNKLNAPLALDGGNSSVHILGHDITAVEHAAGHYLPCLWSHFTMELAGSKQALVISATLKDSW